MTRRARLILLVLAGALLGAPATAPGADRPAAARGAAWLSRAVAPGADGQAADAAIALRAAGRLPGAERRARARALALGVRRYARTAGSIGKVMLGMAALSANPRCVGGVDLRRALARTDRGGRYGRTTYDQTLALLGLRAIGVRPPPAAVRALLRARGGGGWGFALSPRGRDDASATGLALQALRAGGVSRSDRGVRAALRWLAAQRTPAGGFALGRRDRNEANSTALAIAGQRAYGRTDARAERALGGLQRRDGSFQFTATDAGSRVIASTDAVLALAGATLPVAPARAPVRGCR